MKGIDLKFTALGQLLKEGRERKQLSIEQASVMLGMTNRQYLWRCESGYSNFSGEKIKEALSLYRIPVSDAVEACSKDFTESLGKFLRVK